jgi:hypothetical protein
MKLMALFFLIVLPLGCCPAQIATPALKSAWKTLGAEYVAYVEADPKLSPESKATRKRSAEEFERTLEALK